MSELGLQLVFRHAPALCAQHMQAGTACGWFKRVGRAKVGCAQAVHGRHDLQVPPDPLLSA